jgi:hypothetical protein
MGTRLVGEATFIEADSAWKIALEPHAMIFLKRLFPKVNKGELGSVLLAHNDTTAADIAWFFERYPVAIADADRAVLDGSVARHVEQATLLETMLAAGYVPPAVEGMAIEPREYQRQAALMCHQSPRKSLLLGDDMGLGKTCSAITLLMHPGILPAVIVTLTPIPKQWEREVNRFAPHLRTHVLKIGTPYDITEKPRSRRGEKLPFPDVVITSYSKLSGWAEHLAGLGFKTLIGDEVHELRHCTTDRYRAWMALRNRVTYCMGLTGTPVFGMGSQIHHVVSAVVPGALGKWGEFVREWCGQQDDGEDGGDKPKKDDKPMVKDPDALGAHLRREGIMLRRTRKEVNRELPPIQRFTQVVEMDDGPLKAVEGRAQELAKIILSSSASAFTRMEASAEIDWKLRQATGIGKARYVAEFLKMMLANGIKKVLVYAWHREVYNIYDEVLSEHKPVFYTGTESAVEKAESIRRFCLPPEDPDSSPLLIMSLRSGAGLDGLQYSGCHHVVMAELDWAPAVHSQGETRIDRDGQPDPVTVIYLIAESGSDPVLQDALGLKADQAHGIVDPGTEKKISSRAQQDAIRSRIRRMAAAYAGKEAAAMVAELEQAEASAAETGASVLASLIASTEEPSRAAPAPRHEGPVAAPRLYDAARVSEMENEPATAPLEPVVTRRRLRRG